MRGELQRLPATAAQVMQQTAIMKEVPAQDLRDAEDETQSGYLTLAIFLILRLLISHDLRLEEGDAQVSAPGLAIEQRRFADGGGPPAAFSPEFDEVWLSFSTFTGRRYGRKWRNSQARSYVFYAQDGWVLSKKAKFLQMVGQSFSGNAQLTGSSTHIPASSPRISCSVEGL